MESTNFTTFRSLVEVSLRSCAMTVGLEFIKFMDSMVYACNYYVCMYVCTYVYTYVYNSIQYLMFCHAYLHNIYQYPFDVMLYCGIFPHMINCA